MSEPGLPRLLGAVCGGARDEWRQQGLLAVGGFSGVELMIGMAAGAVESRPYLDIRGAGVQCVCQLCCAVAAKAGVLHHVHFVPFVCRSSWAARDCGAPFVLVCPPCFENITSTLLYLIDTCI